MEAFLHRDIPDCKMPREDQTVLQAIRQALKGDDKKVALFRKHGQYLRRSQG